MFRVYLARSAVLTSCIQTQCQTFGVKFAIIRDQLTMAKKKQNFSKLTRDYLAQKGAAHVEKTETFNAFGRNKNDLFGFADWTAIMDFEFPEFWFIQETSRSNISARIKKICDSGIARLIVENLMAKIIVLGWDKDKEGQWRVKKVEIKAEDIGAEILCSGECEEPYWKEG